MGRERVVFECQECGAQYPKWQGRCSECGAWNSLVEGVRVEEKESGEKGVRRGRLLAVEEVGMREFARLATGIGELDRVLGGGLVKGEVVLVVGEPGIGKSTLLTQLAINLGDKGEIIYVCGEESPSQVGLRLRRMGGGKGKKSLRLLAERQVEVIRATLREEKAKLVIVDSIQTLVSKNLQGVAGSVGQIRECTNQLINYAKETGVPVVLVGHVTKTGEIAGPKILEHMVDCVLELSGDRYHELRILRAVKNRFGATDEVGVFRMGERGMVEVANPSEVFLNERDEEGAGSAVTVVMEGTRPILVEIQALVVPTELPVPRRVAEGIRVRKLQVLCGVLAKHGGLRLGERDVFVKVTGGLSLQEPGVDLAVVMAIASSYKNKPLPKRAVAIGEVGLLGEIRGVTMYEKREKEAKKLGYTTIYSSRKWRRVREVVRMLGR